MTFALEQVEALLDATENEHVEFKEAKHDYDFEKLVKYCVALANEGGGRMVLGVTDARPRKIVGSRTFADLTRTKEGLIERLRLRIEAEEVAHPEGRVVIFAVPARPIGMPVQYRGACWMRAGAALVPMTADKLKRIFDEAGPDFSAELCRPATIADLDPAAVEQLRGRWHRKSENEALLHASVPQLLADAELLLDGQLTYAALILLGTREALGRHLPQAEVVFEYRSSESSIPYQQRKEYRAGFFSFLDDLWDLINLRNDLQHFQEGLFVWDIPTFNEAVLREAILNAVSHRDYRLPGSVFLRQFPRKLEVVSPGGFPPGITVENALWKQSPRNRRIAEVLSRCGLVERSGQGMNRMFEGCIRQGKPRPDFFGTDDFQVSVTLHGEVQNPAFLRFLAQIGKERLASFATEDLLVLDLLCHEEPIPEGFKGRVPRLVEHGIIERIGRGRGTRYILSRRFYSFLGRKGVYTRKRGLDRETNKLLLLKHIIDNRAEGSVLGELCQVLPALSRNQVQSLLRELRADGRIRPSGSTKGARWHPAP